MRSSHDLSRVTVTFTETHLIPNAGLLPAAMLTQRVDLARLIDERLHLARHGANSGCKALTVIATMLAGGDSIDDTDVLRVGAAGELFDATRAPSTIGTWLRAHCPWPWGLSGFLCKGLTGLKVSDPDPRLAC